MNKGQGATTIGAILLTGLMFRGGANPGLQESSNASSKPTSAQQSETVTGEGPWLASCKYWAGVLPVQAESSKDTAPVLDIRLNQTGKTIESHVTTSVSSENCSPGTDGWGIPPNTSDEHNPEISAIIATVPDPVHSDLSLDFDRTIDAVLLAAANKHYLSGFYWLPWRPRAREGGQADSSNTSEKPDRAKSREQQPGVIILRYAPDSEAWKEGVKNKRFSQASFYRVIYLFLVAETPSNGVNGNQLQNALKYEDFLVSCHDATLAVRPSPFEKSPDRPPASLSGKQRPEKCLEKGSYNGSTKAQVQEQVNSAPTMSVIGPLYSGSAASLHEALETRPSGLKLFQPSIAGVTSSQVAVRELDPADKKIYRSFGENTGFDQDAFLHALCRSGFELGRVAILSEANTVFGSAATKDKDTGSQQEKISGPGYSCDKKMLSLEFPREISLLRNAQDSKTGKAESNTPTPYLNLSLKDVTGDDTIPRFSNTQSPLSLEAQLMAISHQLHLNHTQFIFLSASNILDDIFLAQFLRRACPDARLVIYNGGDLLFERDVDNEPYIGSLSISSYLLTSLDFGAKVQWLHSDYQSEAIYNATAYIFWETSQDKSGSEPLALAGYRSYPVPDPKRPLEKNSLQTEFLQIPLWISTIGADGYYPLAVLDWCSSKSDAILPTLFLSPSPIQLTCSTARTAVFSESGISKVQHVWDFVPEAINSNAGISPSFIWGVLAVAISLACVGHSLLLLSANFWSPFTRDLDIDCNDQPHRRAVYLNIGTSILVSMAFVTAWPLIVVHMFYAVTRLSGFLTGWLLSWAFIALLVTLVKTKHYLRHKDGWEYSLFNLIALGALIFSVVIWAFICSEGNSGDHRTYAGLFFSYRCMHPLSGVCPLVPVLLLLSAWFLWSICQTARLRFSALSRPHLPARIVSEPTDSNTPYPLYVGDESLEDCCQPVNSCLYENITTLLITREVLRRFLNNLKNRRTGEWCEKRVNWILGSIYLVLFLICVVFAPIRSVDRVLFFPFLRWMGNHLAHYGPTLYELFVITLFFPLLMIALSGWLRVVLIWGALSRGLLEQLERYPIRFAFTRLKGGSWMSMFRQSGLHIRWREMSRSTESIRQLLNHQELKSKPLECSFLRAIYLGINRHIHQIMERVPANCLNAPKPSPLEFNDCLLPGKLWDVPSGEKAEPLYLLYAIDKGYADFCRSVLALFLIPYWENERTGLVEDSNYPGDSEIPKAIPQSEPSQEEGKRKIERRGPTLIRLAEELLVVRYITLIRATLVNIRYLMLFVSASFVLALVAWNTYPFQPRAFIDWCFTMLLIVISVGFISVFAQIHRNAILSRITDTKPNELGWDFYLRIITFGGIPILTWLAYEFPQVGGSLFKILQPGLQVVK